LWVSSAKAASTRLPHMLMAVAEIRDRERYK
jgi:hypothetical protein